MVVDRYARRIRTSGHNPALDESLSDWSWGSKKIKPVTDEGALSLSAFYGGVKLIARTIATLPLQIFEESIDADGHEGQSIKLKSEDTRYLWHRPNPEMTHQTFWERIFGDEVRGNAFIFVEKTSTGMPKELWYIDRNRVRVGRTKAGVKVYEIDNELPMIDYKQGGEIVHIPNWGGALMGYDIVKIAPNALGLGMSAEVYASKFYTENGVPPGIITSDQALTVAQSEAVVERWQKRRAEGSQKIAVLSNGAKFQQLSVDAEKSQQQAIRSFQVREVARLLNLPPHLLAAEDSVSTWGAGMEESNRMLIVFNYQGHINVAEQSVSDDLLVRELTKRYAKFNTAGLLRGNTLQRYQAYRIADFMTINEKRALEELEPIDGGDAVLAMTNMIPLDELGQQAMAAGPGGGQ